MVQGVEIICGAWARSVPPRGSGWVQAQRASSEPVGFAPTRYREVVLTLSKSRFDFRG